MAGFRGSNILKCSVGQYFTPKRLYRKYTVTECGLEDSSMFVWLQLLIASSRVLSMASNGSWLEPWEKYALYMKIEISKTVNPVKVCSMYVRTYREGQSFVFDFGLWSE